MKPRSPTDLAEQLGIKRRLTPPGTTEMFGDEDSINRLYWAGFNAGQAAAVDRERIHAEIESDIEKAINPMVVRPALQVVEAIAAGRIRHLTINY